MNVTRPETKTNFITEMILISSRKELMSPHEIVFHVLAELYMFSADCKKQSNPCIFACVAAHNGNSEPIDPVRNEASIQTGRVR